MTKDTTGKSKGVSLAKGPVALVGLLLLAYGITAFILGGHSFATHPVNGTVNGKTWLGLEVNAWSSLLFVAAGALLLFGAPLHWAAKSMSLIVGLALGAASVIALYDGDDVFGIFAANGPTKLAWGAASSLLLILALLPRVGGKDREPDDRDRDRVRDVDVIAERPVRTERVTTSERVETRPVQTRPVSTDRVRTERIDGDRAGGVRDADLDGGSRRTGSRSLED